LNIETQFFRILYEIVLYRKKRNKTKIDNEIRIKLIKNNIKTIKNQNLYTVISKLDIQFVLSEHKNEQ